MSQSIVLDLIEYQARKSQSRHLDYQVQLTALIAMYLDRPDASAPSARARLLSSAAELRVSASNILAPSENGFLVDATTEIVEMAEADTGLKLGAEAVGPLLDYVAGMVDSSQGKIRDALRLDEDTIASTARKVVLNADLRIASGVSPVIALAMSKRGVLSDMSFKRVDRANNRWSSDIYTRTVVRGLLVATYVETYLMTLISNGITTAVVQGDDGPQTFEILSPELEVVRERYWHPNASRLVSHA